MKAIITLIHGTWARAAGWTQPDSALCQSLTEATSEIGAEVEFKRYMWSGKNRLEARREAAQGLAEQLRQEFKQAPDASHFLIAHSHGGNILLDALREPGIEESLSGIATMSTPFVSARFSGIAPVAVAFSTPVYAILLVLWYLALVLLLLFLVYLASENIALPWILWPIAVLLLFWAGGKALPRLIAAPVTALNTVLDIVPDWIEGLQLLFIQKFSHELSPRTPLFCIRFRRDEALLALNLARFVVKPVRIATAAAASIFVLAWIVFFMLVTVAWGAAVPLGFIDLIFDTSFTEQFEWLYLASATSTLGVAYLSLPATLLLFIIWASLGYVMFALTLGHWGGVFSQLLLDFRITGTPEGAAAVDRVYSPRRWWRVGVHSLSHEDKQVLADISQWLTAVMRKEPR